MLTKHEHIENVTEEITEIKAETEQAFKACEIYGIPFDKKWYVRKDGVYNYQFVEWDKMNADELDTVVCEIETMINKAKALHDSLSALAIKTRELENIDNYAHSDDEA